MDCQSHIKKRDCWACIREQGLECCSQSLSFLFRWASLNTSATLPSATVSLNLSSDMILYLSYANHFSTSCYWFKKEGCPVVANNLCQFSSSGVRQYLSEQIICSMGTIATLFLRWPIAKFVYPDMRPWMLLRVIWLNSKKNTSRA